MKTVNLDVMNAWMVTLLILIKNAKESHAMNTPKSPLDVSYVRINYHNLKQKENANLVKKVILKQKKELAFIVMHKKMEALLANYVGTGLMMMEMILMT